MAGPATGFPLYAATRTAAQECVGTAQHVPPIPQPHLSQRVHLLNLSRVEEIHAEMLKVIGWMNRDLPEWVEAQERFTAVCAEIRRRMGWE